MLNEFYSKSTFVYKCVQIHLEKEMATHSSVLALRIPGMEGAWWVAIYVVAQSQTILDLSLDSAVLLLFSH